MFRRWSSTLAAGVRLVIARLVPIFALHLDFHGRIRVVRSMYLPAALRGIEASLLASDSLRKLRSSIHRVVWSRRQPLASVGAVLRLVLDGPSGCGFVSVGLVGFRWDPVKMGWIRPGLPLLSNLAGPVQQFKAAILDAWRNKVTADLCGREDFRCGPLLDVHGSLQLLNSSHVRERDKALLRSVMVGGVWNGFLLGRVREQPVPCRFCGAPDGDGHLFGGMYLSSSC